LRIDLLLSGKLMRPSRATSIFCFAGVAALLLVPAAWGNFAPRFWGDVTREPQGHKSVAIVREQLTIDLRSLKDANLVHVDVTYELKNKGDPTRLELLFISGEAGVNAFEAQLDGQALSTRILPQDESQRILKEAPPSWEPPYEAPGLESKRNYYAPRNCIRPPDVVAFSVDLPAGPSTLHVRYQSRACGADERPTVTWQLPYVLAPAREWGSFGRLDVTVHVPAGWDARGTPALEREGDTLSGSFSELPADALFIATGSPVPWEYDWAVWLSVAFWSTVLLVVCPLLCWRTGRRLHRYRATRLDRDGRIQWWPRILVIGMGLIPAILWSALVFVSVPLSHQLVRATLHGQDNPNFGNTYLIVLCFDLVIVPCAFLLGVCVTMTTAFREPTPNPGADDFPLASPQ
jgi:hypothetical protein